MTLSKVKWTIERFRNECQKSFAELSALRINEMVGYYLILAKDIAGAYFVEWLEVHPGGVVLTENDLRNIMNYFSINVGVLIEIIAGGGYRRIGPDKKVIQIKRESSR